MQNSFALAPISRPSAKAKSKVVATTTSVKSSKRDWDCAYSRTPSAIRPPNSKR